MAARALEYVVEGDVDLEAGDAALAAGLRLVIGAATSVERTYYDTFDGRLHADGLTLLWQDGGLVLLDDAHRERATQPFDESRDRLLPATWPPGPLRDAVLPLVDVRALLAVARVTGRARTGRVLNDDDKTVVRLALEAPALRIDGPSSRARPLRCRLRLVPVRGYGKELSRVRRDLERGLALTPAGEALPDEAMRAGGRAPEGISSKLAIALRSEQRADSAATMLLTHLLGTIRQNLPGTLDDTDSEFLHDLRVAVRRSRSAQRQLKRVFPPEPLARFRGDFRWLQQATGPTRDLDVQLLELDELAEALPGGAGADLEPLRAILRDRRSRERRRMERALRSRRAHDLLEDWSAFLEGLVALPEDARPHAARPISAVAARRIVKVYRRMVVEGGAIDATSHPEALHDLRKRGKELRYLLEFFTSLYPREVVKPMVKTLKALQDTLGRHHDRAVQIALLRSLRDELATVPDGPSALLAIGALIDHLDRDQLAARADFADRFAAFAAPGQQKLIKETFR
ncbi:MAG TPA: CHAD domain-containing protein [Baekduia sp.]|nr:CHAD domain-containing protein [Baekduia sp.]